MMLDGYRAKVYRVILALAALYNVAFGLWASFWPGSFFWLFELQPPRYPAIWQCLGMVIGLYGLAYGYAALYPERGRPDRPGEITIHVTPSTLNKTRCFAWL